MKLMLIPLVLGIIAPGIATAQSSDDGSITNGDRVVAAGESVDDIVVIGGDLTVLGEVTGDAAVFGGNLIVEEGGTVEGDAFVTGGELRLQGGEVFGEMRTIDGTGGEIAREILEAMGGRGSIDMDQDERDDHSRQIVIDTDRHRDRGSSLGHGFAGLVSTIALALVLAGIGAGLVFYGRPYLETVSDTVRGSAIRSAATGVAASFLVIPAFVVMVVAMAVSIVGIPLLLVAIPMYPLAVFAAGVFGLLAVAHAIGERTAEQSRQPFDMRYRNSYSYLFTGLGMLLTPLVAASLLQMTGFLSFIGTLLQIVTGFAIWVAATTGFGAVILSRGGTRRSWVPGGPDGGSYDGDLFDDDPTRSEPSV